MNPTLQDYLMQIQSEEGANPQARGEENPFTSGVQNAMEATCQSMGVPSREAQEQEARGMGFINFGKAMGQPSPDGQFAGVNRALGSGIDAYLQQRSQQAQMNANVYLESVRQQEAMRAHQLRQNQLDQQARLEEASLQEQRRAHDLTRQNQADTLDLHRQELNLRKRLLSPSVASHVEMNSSISPSGMKEVPLHTMGKQFANKWGELAAKEISQIPINQRTIGTVQDMRDIFEKHPNIGSSFINMIDNEAAGKTENSWWNLLARQFVSNDELSAVQQLKKLTSDLNLSTVMGFSGKSATDILKKAIKDASPSGKLTYDSFNKISDSWSRRANENIQHAKLVENSLSRGMYPMIGEGERVGGSLTSMPGEGSSLGGNDLSKISDEELLKLYHNE